MVMFVLLQIERNLLVPSLLVPPRDIECPQEEGIETMISLRGEGVSLVTSRLLGITDTEAPVGSMIY